MCIVVSITGILYVWSLLVEHDPQITFRPSWDKRFSIEICTILLTIPFAFFIAERR